MRFLPRLGPDVADGAGEDSGDGAGGIFAFAVFLPGSLDVVVFLLAMIRAGYVGLALATAARVDYVPPRRFGRRQSTSTPGLPGITVSVPPIKCARCAIVRIPMPGGGAPESVTVAGNPTPLSRIRNVTPVRSLRSATSTRLALPCRRALFTAS